MVIEMCVYLLALCIEKFDSGYWLHNGLYRKETSMGECNFKSECDSRMKVILELREKMS